MHPVGLEKKPCMPAGLSDASCFAQVHLYCLHIMHSVVHRFLPYDWENKKGKPSTLEAEMLEHFSSETTAWLLAEMEENRNKRVVSLLLGKYDHCCLSINSIT